MRKFARLILALPLACPLAGCSFDKFDGRWVADLPPVGNCCPARIYMDVDGHKITGQSEDCTGVLVVGGKVNAQGRANIAVGGAKGIANFAGENFDAILPGDTCKRHMVGNRGG